MIGTYSEPLIGGGELRVTLQRAIAHFYFAGPDLRYNGTLVEFPAAELPAYADMLRKAWQERQALLASVPPGASMEVPSGPYVIRVGGYFSGLSFARTHQVLARSTADVETVADGFRKSAERVPMIQATLR